MTMHIDGRGRVGGVAGADRSGSRRARAPRRAGTAHAGSPARAARRAHRHPFRPLPCPRARWARAPTTSCGGGRSRSPSRASPSAATRACSPNRPIASSSRSAANSGCPTPMPPEFAGFAGSININVLTAVDRRVWRNCLYTLDRNGQVKERWTQWDHLCAGSTGPGPHRVRISPYDPERRVWVINETFHQIYVFSNDGSTLLKTLGEKGVPGNDATHFARPQDVAFLPDGRILDRRRPRQPSRDDPRPRHELSRRVRRHGQGPRAVQRRARRGRGPERPHLRARSLRRPHQRLQDHGRSGEGRVRRGLSRLHAAARPHRERRQPVDHRPEALAVREARLHRRRTSTPGTCRAICPTGISRCTRSRWIRPATCTAATTSTAARRSSCRSPAPIRRSSSARRGAIADRRSSIVRRHTTEAFPALVWRIAGCVRVPA